jgi:hypothetical protein
MHNCLATRQARALTVQQTVAPPELTGQAQPAATAAMAGLKARIERLAEAGLLGGRAIEAAACEFHAVCEGLAAVELRGLIHDGDEAPIWRDALGASVVGLARTPSTLTPGAS